MHGNEGDEYMKNAVQRFGKFLSAMVMPNIGAFIAWGLITALFIEKGWFPNAKLATMVDPMLKYILPVLIGYQGGKLVAGDRGGVIAVIAILGVICGSNEVMFMGAMAMGPFAGWVIKKFDKAVDGHIPAGFEMLVNNFSIGIIGMILAIIGYYLIGPVMTAILTVLTAGVDFLIGHSLLPLVSVFVEPAKVLFLNNAINHGIFTPLAIEQAAQTGKSILYLVEANGGNWAGLVLAFMFFGKGMAKKSAPGAAIIHIIGGIGEVSFPYALIKPVTILGPICGSIAALFWFQIMGGGAVAAVSPGSIIALAIMSPKGKLLVNLAGYVIAAVVSFLIVAFFLKRDKTPEDEVEEVGGIDMSQFVESHSAPGEEKKATAGDTTLPKKEVKKVAFACDAGMGSSAMGASMLKTQLNKIGMFIDVNHVSIHQIPADIDVIVTNENLYETAKNAAPAGVPVIAIENFLDAAEQAAIAKKIKDMSE